MSGFDTKMSEKMAGSNPNCRRIVAVIIGTLKKISKTCRCFTQKDKKPAKNMQFCMKN